MYIKNLKLKNYRNYKELDIDFSENFNIIFGDNAQGKTNILESIFLCASGKSHRTQKITELIKIGEKLNNIDLSLIKNNVDININMSFNKSEKRMIKINDIKIKKIGNLMGNLIAVFFSPDDLKIIKGSPSDRRRFLDITMSQLRPKYFYTLQQYNKVISQRNVLLKNINEKKELLQTLDIWDSHMISLGSYIIKSRIDFIKNLNIVAKQKHSSITDNSEELKIKYSPSFSVDFEKQQEEIEKIFDKQLKIQRNREIYRGATLIGPQRDDFEIFINEKSVKLFGSQGQQRTAILSLKLSEIEIIKNDVETCPVLLLDDVFSELDDKRQMYLLRSLNNIQTFITCTNDDVNITTNDDVKFIKINNGKVCEV